MVICFTKSLGWNIVVWHENMLGLARNCQDDLAALVSMFVGLKQNVSGQCSVLFGSFIAVAITLS